MTHCKELVSFHSPYRDHGLGQTPVCEASGSRWSECHLHVLLTLHCCRSSLFLFEDVFSRGSTWTNILCTLGSCCCSWFLGDKLSLLVLLAYILIDSDFPCRKLRVELHHRAESSGRWAIATDGGKKELEVASKPAMLCSEHALKSRWRCCSPQLG